MSVKFNLSGLGTIYNESLKRAEPTLAFEITRGSDRLAAITANFQAVISMGSLASMSNSNIP